MLVSLRAFHIVETENYIKSIVENHADLRKSYTR
jgi:hypothetical protein